MFRYVNTGNVVDDGVYGYDLFFFFLYIVFWIWALDEDY